jgi:type 1 fimbriae regulatory protein FimB
MSQNTILGHFLIMEALSKPELLALLAAADAHRKRDHLMILMAYCHGLRASEVVAIKLHDIKDGGIDVRRLKGSKHTFQALLKHENPLLHERDRVSDYIEKGAFSNSNQRLFAVTRRTFGRIVELHAISAGLPENKRKPHMLKHTMGTEIYEKTKDLRLVQQHLGHSKPESSLIYSGRAESQAADAAVQALIRT